MNLIALHNSCIFCLEIENNFRRTLILPEICADVQEERDDAAARKDLDDLTS